MNEKPILFNAEMVNAILSGRKTQTRRIMKSDCMEIAERDDGLLWPWREDCERGGDIWYPCPLGAVGDQLWVRETFCLVNDAQYGEADWIDYRATPRYSQKHPAGWDCEPSDPEALKWTPSIHMPRWASRINLLITGVRVERLRDISEQDAMAEGVSVVETPASLKSFGEAFGLTHCPKISAFANLWQSIYGSWGNNPWVWVIEFERMEAK